MENENKTNTPLEDMRELDEVEKISSVTFSEPELKDFDASSIFEIKQEEKKPAPFRFGKRSERKRKQVSIKNYDEEMPDFSKRDQQAAARDSQEVPAAADNADVQPANENEQVIPVVDHTTMTTEVPVVNHESVLSVDEALAQAGLYDKLAKQKHPETATEQEMDSIVLKQDANTAAMDETVSHTTRLNADDLTQIKTAPSEPVENGTIADEIISADNAASHENVERSYTAPDYDAMEDTSLRLNPDEFAPALDTDNMVSTGSEELYRDRCSYSMASYPKIEQYLDKQSAQGYHFVKADGKRYYFLAGKPRNYYYSLDYFRHEPSEEEMEQWEKEGWVILAIIPGRLRNDAGWYVLRNVEKPNQKHKDIENDKEKLRYFKKVANSYRSTEFLLFVCMVCCAITAWLQVSMYNGMWGILIACAVIFIACLIAFFVYARYQGIYRKRARILRKKIRDANSGNSASDESDKQLDEEWDELDGDASASSKKPRMKKVKNS